MLWAQYPEEHKRLWSLTGRLVSSVMQLSEQTLFSFQLQRLKELEQTCRQMAAGRALDELDESQRVELASAQRALLDALDGRGRARLMARPKGEREAVRAGIKFALLKGDLELTRRRLGELMPWPWSGAGEAFWEDLEALAQVSELLSMYEVSDAAHELLDVYPDVEVARALGEALIEQDMASSAASVLHGCWLRQGLDAESTIAYSDALLAMKQPRSARAVLMSAGLERAEVLTDPRLQQRLNLIEAQIKRMN
jgi:hypothetical protein